RSSVGLDHGSGGIGGARRDCSRASSQRRRSRAGIGENEALLIQSANPRRQWRSVMGEANERVGMIGVGLMGHGIARNLLRHGHELHFLEHPGNQPVDDLLAAGARTCSSAAELAAGCPVLILCVTGTLQVEDVLLRDAGVLDGLREGAIVVDCSTAIPWSTLRIDAATVACGGRFLLSPMTRTPREAAEVRLNLLVGGDADLFDPCPPLLASFAENILHAGPVGAGHRLKL